MCFLKQQDQLQPYRSKLLNAFKDFSHFTPRQVSTLTIARSCTCANTSILYVQPQVEEHPPKK